MSRVYLICQHCGERLKVVETLAGQKVRCPSCLGVSLVPNRPARRQVDCEQPPLSQESTIDAPVDDTSEADSVRTLKLRLEIESSGAFVTLYAEHGLGGVPELDTLLEVMESQAIRHGIDRVAIEEFYRAFRAGEVEHGHSVCVARCTQPRLPIGDRFELVTHDVEDKLPIEEALSADEEGEEGRVDFRESGRIMTIESGDVVAHLVAGKVGETGTSVTGESLPIPEGDVETDVLGHGVAFDPDGRTVRATQSGRPVLFDNTLSILQVYEVESDVDFSTGNIRFDGHVIVKGSVLDEFEIECKSLEVVGPVGAATIFVESDAVLAGGINGNGKCRLFIGGRCEAKYVNQVSAHIGGDLVVERGITNSEIVCWGSLSASRVVGGKSSARLGYLIEDLGSDLGVVTVVAPGLTHLPTFYGQSLGEAEEPVEPVSKSIELSAEVHSDAEPESSEATAPTAILASVRQALLNKFLGQRAANDDVERMLSDRVDVVNITSKMFADVVVCSATRCKEFVEKSAGKMSIRLNEENGDFEKMPFRKLRVTRMQS